MKTILIYDYDFYSNKYVFIKLLKTKKELIKYFKNKNDILTLNSIFTNLKYENANFGFKYFIYDKCLFELDLYDNIIPQYLFLFKELINSKKIKNYIRKEKFKEIL